MTIVASAGRGVMIAVSAGDQGPGRIRRAKNIRVATIEALCEPGRCLHYPGDANQWLTHPPPSKKRRGCRSCCKRWDQYWSHSRAESTAAIYSQLHIERLDDKQLPQPAFPRPTHARRWTKPVLSPMRLAPNTYSSIPRSSPTLVTLTILTNAASSAKPSSTPGSGNSLTPANFNM